MFKTQDFEELWYRYKSEGEPNSLSIERYCMMQVTVRTTGGFKIHQSGLDYEGLKRFLAKLEGLC